MSCVCCFKVGHAAELCCLESVFEILVGDFAEVRVEKFGVDT